MKRMLASLPFHAYSSYNKRGGKTHPRVAKLRNQVMDLWAEMADYPTIAERLEISIGTVVTYIARARHLGDPRAIRPFRHKKIMRAAYRRRQIQEMHAAGMKPSEIAAQLGCTPELVKLRLKEKTNG